MATLDVRIRDWLVDTYPQFTEAVLADETLVGNAFAGRKLVKGDGKDKVVVELVNVRPDIETASGGVSVVRNYRTLVAIAVVTETHHHEWMAAVRQVYSNKDAIPGVVRMLPVPHEVALLIGAPVPGAGMVALEVVTLTDPQEA